MDSLRSTQNAEKEGTLYVSLQTLESEDPGNDTIINKVILD